MGLGGGSLWRQLNGRVALVGLSSGGDDDDAGFQLYYYDEDENARKKNSTYWSTPPILIFKNFHWHVMISWKRVAMIGDEICPFFS